MRFYDSVGCGSGASAKVAEFKFPAAIRACWFNRAANSVTMLTSISLLSRTFAFTLTVTMSPTLLFEILTGSAMTMVAMNAKRKNAAIFMLMGFETLLLCLMPEVNCELGLLTSYGISSHLSKNNF